MAIEPPKPTTEAEILQLVSRQIAARLPTRWSSELSSVPRFGAGNLDGIMRIVAPDGREAVLAVEAKTTLNTRDVLAALAQVREAAMRADLLPAGASPLIVSRYLNSRTRALLADQGASFADATGNLRLLVDDPAIFIEALGAESDPWRGPDRDMRTLKGRPAGRVVRGLIDFYPPVGIRDLAKRAGASLGSTSRVVDFLEREALVERDERGTIPDVDWPSLLRRWSEDYSFQKVNTIISGFEPRGPKRVIERLKSAEGGYAVTGSLSAIRVAELADVPLATIYADDPSDLWELLGLRSTGPPNVRIARPSDPLPMERPVEDSGVAYAAWSQTAVDLLSGPGRSPAEGEALIGWMVRNEHAWRR